MRVGIDIGGTKTAAVVVDRNGTVLHEVKQPTGYGAEEVISTVTQVTRQLADRAGCPVSDFRSIGIGIPGAVNTATGRVDHAVNLGLVEFELGAESARLLGSPVVVENDVNAAAVGAYRLVNGGVGGGAAGGTPARHPREASPISTLEPGSPPALCSTDRCGEAQRVWPVKLATSRLTRLGSFVPAGSEAVSKQSVLGPESRGSGRRIARRPFTT